MRVLKVIIILSIFLFLIIFLGKLVSYKYIDSLIEGSFTSDYYYEKNNHDVIFLGDCEAYTSFSPIEIYNNYGITSYVRGNSQQLIGQSYYILSETLHYEKPKIVVLSVGAMRYENQTKEEYNRLILDKMRWSKEKVDMINYSMMKDESFLSYLFPLLRYHSRITKLESEDFKYLFNNKVVSYNGFIINKDIKPLGKLPNKTVLDKYDFTSDNIMYLEKIVSLCKENNITLILSKSPTLYPYWYSEYDNWMKDFASRNNLDYYNFLDYISEIGIDYNYDTYDSGVHLNLNGAEKFSKYFGKILKEKYYLQDNRSNDKINNEYEEKIKKYYEVVYEKVN